MERPFETPVKLPYQATVFVPKLLVEATSKNTPSSAARSVAEPPAKVPDWTTVSAGEAVTGIVAGAAEVAKLHARAAESWFPARSVAPVPTRAV